MTDQNEQQQQNQTGDSSGVAQQIPSLETHQSNAQLTVEELEPKPGAAPEPAKPGRKEWLALLNKNHRILPLPFIQDYEKLLDETFGKA